MLQHQLNVELNVKYLRSKITVNCRLSWSLSLVKFLFCIPAYVRTVRLCKKSNITADNQKEENKEILI